MEIIYKTNKNFKNANAFLFGLKNFSTLENEITLEELKDLSNKKVFLSLDKNMFNSDLKELEEKLKEIDNFNIAGILFYDLAVLAISKKLKLKTPIIWSQNYFVTNYKTCNFYEQEGVKGAVVSPLITHEEISNICKKTNFDIFINVFGYQTIAMSKRYLISNYFKYIKEENNKEINYMIEKTGSYPTKEIKNGTKIYTKDILNSIKYVNEMKKAKVKYLILDSFMIDSDTFEKISRLYEKAVNEELTNEKLNQLEKQIKKLIPNSSTMFLDKKSIFKVKRK